MQIDPGLHDMKIKRAVPLVLLAVIWGCYYVATQQSVAKMSVFSVGVVVRFITMVLLLILMVSKKEVSSLLKVKKTWPRLLLIGVLGYSLDLTAFLGLSYASAGIGTAILKCDIIFINLLSVIFYKERFTKKDWTFSLLMLFGVFLIMDIDFGSLELANKGNIFFVLSALFVSINAFVIKSVQTDKENPVQDNVVAFYNNFITMILFLISTVVMGTTGQIAGIGSDRGLLLALSCAGIGQTLVYVVYYYNLRNNPVWIVKVFLLLMPIVSMLVSLLLFGTTIKAIQCIGVGIVLLGALGILLEQKKKTAENS